MMQQVLIIPAPVLSHINASFKVASLLKRHNYQIHYFAHFGVAPLVTQQNFGLTVAQTPPIMEGYRKALRKHEHVKLGYWTFLRNGGLRGFFNKRRQELMAVVERVRPNLIIADTFTAADFAFIYPLIKRYHIRFIQLETMPCTLDIKGYPSFSAFTLPQQKRKIAIEYYVRTWSKKMGRIKDRLLYLGMDTYSLLKKEMKRNAVPLQYHIEKRNHFSLSFTGLPTILPLPLEWEFFSTPPTPNHHYLGFWQTGSSQVGTLPEKRLEKLLELGKPVVYISFGTVFGGIWAKHIAAFMQKLDAAMAELQEAVAIFSLGTPQATAEAAMANFTHIHTFAFVPQIHLLNHCRVFVTHGGINSIKESIQAAVPMLVVPLDVDQPGNAAKIVYKGLGLATHIVKETSEGIQYKLKALLNDVHYKERLLDFRDSICKGNKAEEKLINVITSEGVVC